MKKMTYEAMPAASMSVEEVENLMDDVADRQKDMEEIQNRMMETVEQENVDDVLKEVDEAIVNEALPLHLRSLWRKSRLVLTRVC